MCPKSDCQHPHFERNNAHTRNNHLYPKYFQRALPLSITPYSPPCATTPLVSLRVCTHTRRNTLLPSSYSYLLALPTALAFGSPCPARQPALLALPQATCRCRTVLPLSPQFCCPPHLAGRQWAHAPGACSNPHARRPRPQYLVWFPPTSAQNFSEGQQSRTLVHAAPLGLCTTLAPPLILVADAAASHSRPAQALPFFASASPSCALLCFSLPALASLSSLCWFNVSILFYTLYASQHIDGGCATLLCPAPLLGPRTPLPMPSRAALPPASLSM